MEYIKYFLRTENENFVFPIFSKEHLLFLSIILAIGLLLVIFSPTIKKSRFNQYFRYGIVTILIVHRIIRFTYYVSTGQYTIQEYLPLHICHVGDYALIFALLTSNAKACNVAYFFALIGGVVGCLTPDIGYQHFPHITFVLFFTQHVLMPYGVLFLLFVDKVKPNLENFKFVLKFSFIFSIFIIIFNTLTGANYLYLRTKPISGSILDFLPEYPYYVPVAVLLFFIYLGLAYLPFYLTEKIRGARKIMVNKKSDQTVKLGG